jgi:hypothetical protein
MRNADWVDQISWHQNHSEVEMVRRRKPAPFVKSSCRLENGLAVENLNGLRSSGLSVSDIVSCIAMELSVSKLEKCSSAARPKSRATATPMNGPAMPARSIQKPSADLWQGERSRVRRIYVCTPGPGWGKVWTHLIRAESSGRWPKTSE